MLRIRQATLRDCPACGKLGQIEELRCADGTFIDTSYYEVFVDRDQLFFVAEEDETVVGFILGEPMKGNLAYLGLFAVSHACRGKGIGKMLIAAFRKRCDEIGIKYIFFFAPMFNESTLQFYRRQGFIEGKPHVSFLEKR